MTSRPDGHHSFTFTVDAWRIPCGDDPFAADADQRRPTDPTDHRRLRRLLRDVGSDRRQRAVHGDGADADQRPRSRTGEHRGIARDRDELPRRDQGALPAAPRRIARTERSEARGEDPRRGPVGGTDRPRGPDRQGAQVVDATCTPPTSPTCRAAGCPRSSASPPTRRASASTTRPRWRSSCVTWVSRPGSRRASCPGRATRTRPPRRSCSAMPTPGSRSTSRATAGSRSIRPALSRSWRRCRRATRPRARRCVHRPRRRERAAGSSRAPTPGSIGPARAGSAAAGSLGPLVAVLALLLLIVGAVAFVAWQRGPRGGTTADDAYGTVTRIASRFGFGPRPNQTVYEYAGVLSDVLPIVRPELETVARAKVESVYAREILGDERIAEPQGGAAPAAGEPAEAGVPTTRTPRRSARERRSGCVPRGLPAPFRR